MYHPRLKWEWLEGINSLLRARNCIRGWQQPKLNLSFWRVLERYRIMLWGRHGWRHRADDILKLRVLARKLPVGAVLCELGTNEGAQILTQFNAHEKDDTVGENHAEQHRQILPLPHLRFDAVHLLDHIPAWNWRPNLFTVQHVVFKCKPGELIEIHSLPQEPSMSVAYWSAIELIIEVATVWGECVVIYVLWNEKFSYLKCIHVESDVGEWVAPYWLWEVVN